MSEQPPLTSEAFYLARWRKRWQEINCNTEPANRPRAEYAISELYRFMGEGRPQFLWMDSPAEAVQLIRTQPSYSLGPKLTFEFQEKVKTILKLELENRVDSAFLGMLKRHVKSVAVTPDPFIAAAGSKESLMRILVPNDWKAGRTEPYWREPGSLLIDGDAVCYEFFSAFNAREKLMCCTFGRDVMQLKYRHPLSRYLDLCVEAASACGCWWAHKEVCIVTERPRTMHLDENGRLHHSAEAALEFRNGFQVYMWHGWEVPETWIKEPDKIDPMCALTWDYSSLRPVAGEILGWDHIFRAAGGRTIDTHENPEIGELIEIELAGNGGKRRFLKLRSAIGRMRVLSVPPTLQTALAANAWTYDLPPDECQSGTKPSITQEDVLFRRIPELPAGVVKQDTKGWIEIAGSTQGHRYVIANPAVSLFTYRPEKKPLFLSIEADQADLVHDWPFDPQETLQLGRGCWEIRWKREWIPTGGTDHSLTI